MLGKQLPKPAVSGGISMVNTQDVKTGHFATCRPHVSTLKLAMRRRACDCCLEQSVHHGSSTPNTIYSTCDGNNIFVYPVLRRLVYGGLGVVLKSLSGGLSGVSSLLLSTWQWCVIWPGAAPLVWLSVLAVRAADADVVAVP
eukprot:364279-Chlamydomonas_euryale.AAC.6